MIISWTVGYLSSFRGLASQAVLSRTVRSGSITTLPPTCPELCLWYSFSAVGGKLGVEAVEDSYFLALGSMVQWTRKVV